jgi:hypothetical protein
MTITKTSNRAKQAIANAKDIRCFSLSNNFSGQSLAADPVVWGGPVVENRFTELVHVTPSEFLAKELIEGRHAKLTVSESGRYTLHVHSNLWYEFAS